VTTETEEIERTVEATAAAMKLASPEEGFAIVVEHLAVAYRMAPLVMDFPLGDEQDVAPVYAP
jgi:hypothetical protein